jgi:hypothetical protein
MKPLPADGENPLVGATTHHDLILWLAYKEAAALLGIRKLKEVQLGGEWRVRTEEFSGLLNIYRNGNKISGTIQLNSKSKAYEQNSISGTITSTGIQFAREIKGRGEQKWVGTLQGNEITVKWTGLGSTSGEATSWSATRK